MNNVLNERKKESYKIFDQIAHRYDFLNRVLSMGIDIYWRKQLRRWLPNKEQLKVLDLATGTADVALELAKDQRVASIEGIDPSKEMLEIGTQKIRQRHLENKISLEQGNGENIQRPDNNYDVTTVSFGIRNYGDPLKGLQEKLRVLKPGGVSLILEFGIPQTPIIKQLYLFYFRKILPIFGNILSQHKDAYTYLNKTAETIPLGEKFVALMQEAGYKKITTKSLTFGIAILYRREKAE
jgi:demethylmenaquinone methyltransferase/2-methoxy-6-polyprenyl-1,4-benzoquinol methylase